MYDVRSKNPEEFINHRGNFGNPPMQRQTNILKMIIRLEMQKPKKSEKGFHREAAVLLDQ